MEQEVKFEKEKAGWVDGCLVLAAAELHQGLFSADR